MIGSYPPGRKWMASKWKAEVFTPGNWKTCGNRWMWMWFFFKFQAFFFLMFHGNFMKQMHTIHIGISSMNIFWVGWRKWLKGTWLNHIGHLFFRSHIHLRNNFCCTTCGTGGELIDLDWGGVERCQMLVVNLYQQISLISTLVLFRQHSWKYRETSNKSFHPKTVPHEQLWKAMRCWGEPPDGLEGVEADRMACALEPGDWTDVFSNDRKRHKNTVGKCRQRISWVLPVRNHQRFLHCFAPACLKWYSCSPSITRGQHSGARGWDKRSRQLSSTKITSMGCLLCRTFNVQECATFMVSLVGAAASEFSSLIFPILMAFLMKVHTRQIHWRNVVFTGTLLDQRTDPFTVLRSGIRMLQVGSRRFLHVAGCWHLIWDANHPSGDSRSRKGRVSHVHDAIAMSNHKLYV